MLIVKNISFSYDDFLVLKDVSFIINKGQNIALIGESGCGKSTLLKLIYGLYDLKNGEISYDSKPIFGPKFNLIPGEEYIKYLAQDFDLMPYITVEENVGKFLSNIYKDKKTNRIQELLEMVEMTAFAKVKAKYLSGGQQQRVALAKVLALEPKVLLLDEPFSQIDTFRKNTLRRNLFRYLKEKQITCIVATHDSKDILAFADETIVMQDGKLIEKGKTKSVYEQLKNKYIAALFDEVNEIPANIFNNSVALLAYPHQLEVAEKSNLKVTINNNYFKGNGYLVEAVFEMKQIYFESLIEYQAGESVFLTLKV
ncbi:ABC transporter ATP-binding protein [Flavobacterium luteum]|uniref:ABC transporter ATP-binding protein n=1 Tax=Flavobacterium luteum TaxID=2026654 RepID=A0A7J5ACC7_9FLAO|nr:ABC transporter ATP-binding protein [Flavobacterium luteum]KAB1155098.1 ABC transporter ATP-binding protein [Flavobacterium luteum]